MATLTYFGVSYECTRVIRGDDYVHLLDSADNLIVAFDGVKNFDNFTLTGCSYSTPTPDHDCFVAVIRDDGTIAKGSHRCSAIANVFRANITVPAAGWSDTAPYTQTIPVVGLSDSDVPKIDVSFSDSIDDDTYDAVTDAYNCLTYCAALNSQLVLKCRYDKPSTDFSITVEAVR